MSQENPSNEPTDTPENPGQPPSNTPSPDNPKTLTEDDVKRIVSEIVNSKEGNQPANEPTPETPTITASQARKMVEAAAQKALEGKPSPPQEQNKEPEKPPVTIRKLTKLLWGEPDA